MTFPIESINRTIQSINCLGKASTTNVATNEVTFDSLTKILSFFHNGV